MVPSNIVLDMVLSPHGKGDLGIGTAVKMCMANCDQTVTDSWIVTRDSLLELRNALSNGTTADPIHPPFLLADGANWADALYLSGSWASCLKY